MVALALAGCAAPAPTPISGPLVPDPVPIARHRHPPNSEIGDRLDRLDDDMKRLRDRLDTSDLP